MPMLNTRSISASFDRAQPLQPGEDLGDRPRPAAQPDGAALRQDARRVVDQSAAGDVGDAVHDPLDPVVPVDGLDGRHVDPRRLEQLVGDGPAELRDERLGRQARLLEDDLPRQAVAIGMQARAGQRPRPCRPPGSPGRRECASARRPPGRIRPGRIRPGW